MIVTFVGGTDENQTYANTLNCTIDYFNEHDVDVLIRIL